MLLHQVIQDSWDTLQNSSIIFLFILIGGIIPSLFWLWFWMQEDNKHKEPRLLILKVFALGMFGVFISFFLQKAVGWYFNIRIGNIEFYANTLYNHPLVNLIFVIVEEFIKYLAAYILFFRTKLFNEPIDAFIYLMTAAIGFSAMENAMYLINPLLAGDTAAALIHSNMRFIGASVLHVASSGILALSIGYAFCKKPWIREMYAWLGLSAAVLIHWLFNIMLLNFDEWVLVIFASVWVIMIYLIINLERIKKITC